MVSFRVEGGNSCCKGFRGRRWLSHGWMPRAPERCPYPVLPVCRPMSYALHGLRGCKDFALNGLPSFRLHRRTGLRKKKLHAAIACPDLSEGLFAARVVPYRNSPRREKVHLRAWGSRKPNLEPLQYSLRSQRERERERERGEGERETPFPAEEEEDEEEEEEAEEVEE